MQASLKQGIQKIKHRMEEVRTDHESPNWKIKRTGVGGDRCIRKTGRQPQMLSEIRDAIYIMLFKALCSKLGCLRLEKLPGIPKLQSASCRFVLLLNFQSYHHPVSPEKPYFFRLLNNRMITYCFDFLPKQSTSKSIIPACPGLTSSCPCLHVSPFCCW